MSPERGSLAILSPRFLFGALLLVLGISALADNLGYDVDTGLVLPVGVILVAIGFLLRGPGEPAWVWSWIWLGAGVWWLLDILGYVRFGFWQTFPPLLLVGAGALLVRRATRGPAIPRRPTDHDDRVSAFVVMGGNDRRVDSQSFRGGDLLAIMGGCVLDLTNAKSAPEGAVVDVVTLWGGIEIRVPPGWRVRSEVVPLLGGFEDKTRPTQGEPTGLLVVRGVAIMGGVEVKH